MCIFWMPPDSTLCRDEMYARCAGMCVCIFACDSGAGRPELLSPHLSLLHRRSKESRKVRKGSRSVVNLTIRSARLLRLAQKEWARATVMEKEKENQSQTGLGNMVHATTSTHVKRVDSGSQCCAETKQSSDLTIVRGRGL